MESVNKYVSTNLKASTSRRWHFWTLMAQKPAHPVGSSGSRGLLHIGTSSSTRATHTSLSKQSSQYLVALTFWLASSVSASVDVEEVSGNGKSPFKRALTVNTSALVFTIAVVVAEVVSVSAKFGSSFEITGVNDSPDVTFSPVHLSVDDFRYCWMIWSFSGSVKKRRDGDQSSGRPRKRNSSRRRFISPRGSVYTLRRLISLYSPIVWSYILIRHKQVWKKKKTAKFATLMESITVSYTTHCAYTVYC